MDNIQVFDKLTKEKAKEFNIWSNKVVLEIN